MDSGLRRIVTARIEAEGASQEWGPVLLAALGGRDGLEAFLAGRQAARRETGASVAAQPPMGGAFLRAIAVEGFRGVGRAQTLELSPGPGLTLVVGRNGSGKSSFAEAVETLLTGDSLRWKDRAAVWRDGWRNLHHPSASLRGTFVVEGASEPYVVSRRWEADAAFEVADVRVEREGASSAGDADVLGWTSALR